MDPEQRQQLWQRIVTRVSAELAELPAEERDWLERQLQLVGNLQRQLHALFEQACGARICRDCRGACCEHGALHFNLVNLLGYLVSGRPLIQPDFTASCPYLGVTGCRIPVELRPFNCVTFVCTAIEDRMASDQLEQFYALERRLRQASLAFDQRYQGSSLHGLLQSGQQLAGRAFLQRP